MLTNDAFCKCEEDSGKSQDTAKTSEFLRDNAIDMGVRLGRRTSLKLLSSGYHVLKIDQGGLREEEVRTVDDPYQNREERRSVIVRRFSQTRRKAAL